MDILDEENTSNEIKEISRMITSKDIIKEILENRINEKYEGKELMFCSLLYNTINFSPEYTTFCCSASHFKPSIMYSHNLDNFKLKKYVNALDKIMNENQTLKGACVGCNLLKRQVVSKFSLKNSILAFAINNFLQCNSKCVYCDSYSSSQGSFYNLLPVIKRMHYLNMFSNATFFHWGGGEPLIYKEFDTIAEFVINNNYRQLINSSGLKFSEHIVEGLKQKTLSLRISPDAGTSLTYLKVKGQKGFDIVWGNIKKYCQYPDNVFVKYIVFSYNSNEDEIKLFMQKCLECGVKNIIISVEASSLNNSRFGEIGDNEVNAAKLMKKIAIENSINFEYESIWQWDKEVWKKLND